MRKDGGLLGFNMSQGKRLHIVSEKGIERKNL
uniref:Uncharacterized protein n=1 Tax=Anguilla anguilla TaxID=7936 RepID=A0A0E9QCC2_ANGAN